MDTREKYANVFRNALNIEADNLEDLTYQSVRTWDSVGHMALVAALEDAFDIMLDTEDILELSSYKKGREILAKYDIQF